jgi:hypothetical protein
LILLTVLGYNEVNVPNYFATIRTDNNAVLGVVGRSIIVQNRETFSFFDAIVGGTDGILYARLQAL